MSLTDEELDRLADIVRLQPTKNRELQERWDMESGSEVHRYLENKLSDYYFRDDDSLIRATAEAAELTGVEPGVEEGADGESGEAVPEVVRVPTLQARILEVLAGPDEETESVVRVLGKLRDAFDIDPEAGDVRRGLQSLRRKNVVEVVYRTVPTFRLAVPREELTVEDIDEERGQDIDEEQGRSTRPEAASSGPDADANGDRDGESVLDELDAEFDEL